MKKRMLKLEKWFRIGLLIAIIVMLNIILSSFFTRVDLTKEKRFTLSGATKELLNQIDDVLYVKVYLEGENFPAGFKRLQQSTREMLDEFRYYANGKLEYEFVDPFENVVESNRNNVYQQMLRKGLQPTNLKVKEEESYSEKIIFPGATINYKGQEVPLLLLQNQVSLGAQEILNNSISLMEYTLAAAVKKAVITKKPKVAFLQGHGELNKFETEDLRKSMQESYRVDTLDIRNVLTINPSYEAIIIAKPRLAFQEHEKYKIDQYLMQGGKIMWLIEPLRADMQLLGKDQFFLTQQYDLNLEDQLFRYGVRINSDLVQDLQCVPIPLVVGNLGGKPQTQLYPWPYFPMVFSKGTHPIVKNLDGIMFQFASTIDTIKVRDIKKTVLLQSSEYSKALKYPVRVHLGMLKYQPDPARYNQPNQNLAVLLEGEFTSVFKNRLSYQTKKMIDSLQIPFIEKSKQTKMVVISDGDVMLNEYDEKGTTYPVGYYRYTQQTFDNKNFLLNTLEYLCDKTNLIQTRSKEIKLRLLDKIKVKKEKITWQWINIAFPILSIWLLGGLYYFIRRKQYTS